MKKIKDTGNITVEEVSEAMNRTISRTLTACPVCDAGLRITELTCSHCNTRLGGVFMTTPLARVPHEHQTFIETFVRCRGVIRDVERVLGISYPTVRTRLDAAVEALEAVLAADRQQTVQQGNRRRAILEQVEGGLLSPEEAAERLRYL